MPAARDDDEHGHTRRSSFDAPEQEAEEVELEAPVSWPGRRTTTSQMSGPPLKRIDRKGDGGVSASARDSLLRAAGSPATPLPGGLRGQLETSLGSDLSGVQVHTGSASAEAAKSVGASAYAVGQDIHFGAGNFTPETPAGRSLIAHEVAHTVQQRGASADVRQDKLEVSSPGDAHEVEAESFARSFAAGGATTVSPVSAGTVARAVIHRGPPDAGGGADPGGAPQAAATWQVPALFGGGSVNNGADASAKLIDIKTALEPLKEHFAGIPMVFAAIEKILPETYGTEGAGPLKPELASKLQGAGLASVGAYNVALTEMKAKIRESLGSIKEDHAGPISEAAAEILHETAFGKEADGESFEHAKEGFEKVHIFVEWAHYTNEWVTTALKMAQSAEKFEKIAEALEHAGEWGEKGSIAIAALNSAMAFYSAIKVSKDPGKSGTQKAIANTKAGFSIVPVVTAGAAMVGSMTAAATGVGLLWTTLVPQIEQGFKMIEHVEDMAKAFYKATSADEWWEEAQKGAGGHAPQIPKEIKFPGDQATLDFMWAVFRGNPPETAPAAVEKFFYDAKDKMNEQHEGGSKDADKDEMETEWHLFKANEVKNLIPWVQRHKDEVWAMLYGGLPHP